MRLGTNLTYSGDPRAAADQVAGWERHGLDVVWVSEAYGFDAPTVMGYLAARTPRLDGTLRWTVAQGVEMGRPSRLELEADKRGGDITAVRVGGSAVVVSSGTLRLR